MLSNLDALTARLDAERYGNRRIYRVGATPNPALRLVPTAYARVREKYPDLVLELVEASTDDLLSASAAVTTRSWWLDRRPRTPYPSSSRRRFIQRSA